MRRGLAPGFVALAALALGVAGCGSDDHPNEDRPPDPIELTGKVTNQKVTISPSEFGAGEVHITLANLSRDPVTLTLEGPDSATGPIIQPGSVGGFDVQLSEGTYAASAGADSEADPDELEVGPERPSSQNELLLP